MLRTALSVVIPTKNNSKTLSCLLNSINQQTPGVVEVIVVDGQSQDDTLAIAERLGARVVSYGTEGDQRGLARNLGARVAHGEFLIFLDSDMQLAEGVIDDCSQLISAGAEAIIIPEVTLGSGCLGRTRAWERRLVERSNLTAVARVVRKATFDRVGGFNPEIVGFEDLDFQAKLIEAGVAMTRSSVPLFHHEEDIDVITYLRKRMYYSRSAHLYRSFHPQLSKGVFSFNSRTRTYLSGIKSSRDFAPFICAVWFRALEVIAWYIIRLSIAVERRRVRLADNWHS